MVYYAKFDKQFYIAAVYLTLCVLISVRIYTDHKTYDYYWLIPGILYWSLLSRRVFSILYLKLFKKPIFTANEYYVFDHFENIKYYWDDIDEIVAEENLLVVQLDDPAKYYSEIKVPFLKFKAFLKHKVFRRKLTYYIDLDLIDIKKGKHKMFVDTLNDLSIPA